MSSPDLPRYGPPDQPSEGPLPDQPPTAPIPDQSPAAPPPGYGPVPGQPQYPQGQYPQGQPPYPYPYPPQPGYGQPGYGQPGAQPPYPYPYAPQPPKRSHRTLWIVLGVVGGLVVVCGAACAVGIALLANQFGNAFGPYVTVASFCAYEEQSDYSQSYNLLSPTLQTQMTETQWEQANLAREQNNGAVRSCTPSSSGNSVGTSSATIQIQLTLNDGSHSGPVTLVKEGGQWKIDSIYPGLGIT